MNPNPTRRGVGGHSFRYDFTQGGTVFVDPDGDPLRYDVWMWYRTGGVYTELSVVGTTLTGTLPADGAIDVHIEAHDDRGPSTPDSFVIDKDALEAFLHTLTDEEFLNDPRYADPFQ